MPSLSDDIKQHISEQVDLNSYRIVTPETESDGDIDEARLLVHTRQINDVRYINQFFEDLNASLNSGDLLVGCFETFTSRRNRKRVYHLPVINKFFLIYEFLFLRVVPKIRGLRSIYFLISKGKGQLLSKAEVLGRLVCCGYEIQDYYVLHGTSWFIAKKVKEPSFDRKASYGPLIRMNRIGVNGKPIRVYKFRTMHPYSEYLHDYVLKQHGYAKSGKPAKDFRLTPWGRILRKYWLDELPQLINVLKGEMKLVGVRPVTQRYFQDIPHDLRELRLTQKPGCIPPYVSLNRLPDVKSVQLAEKEYILEKLKHPYTTDLRYFFRAIFNIIVRKKRSA
jgi:lipopolysaccharide/colanic/teichoic acid biosynthesis glycosyltransferase